jgi:ABC-type cobalamin/Fe3+-siderophores transport system ATPase subunit
MNDSQSISIDLINLNNENIKVNVSKENPLFVLGRNGSGKSSLMYHIYRQHSFRSIRILAHRQNWFSDSTFNINNFQKNDLQRVVSSSLLNSESRWKDEYSQQKISLCILDLINKHNKRARQIADLVDSRAISISDGVSDSSPLSIINNLLKRSNINISIEIDADEKLVACKGDSIHYSINELSDGERSALLIGAETLTASPETVILIDEPERHLHRSIIIPFLSHLFKLRSDCFFVVSTHDVELPYDFPESKILIMRNSIWGNKIVTNWDFDIINCETSLPNDVISSVIGSKRRILFVEGEKNGFDQKFYQSLFPEFSVIARGSCIEVEKSVVGLSSLGMLHWLTTRGIVDGDGREAEEIDKLSSKGIATLEVYSIESLIYCPVVLDAVINRISRVYGRSPHHYDHVYADFESIFMSAQEHLCSRISEKKVRRIIMSDLPTHKTIRNRTLISIELDVDRYMSQEMAVYMEQVSRKEWENLIAKYPVRESTLISNICQKLELNEIQYKDLIITMIQEDQLFKDLLIQKLINVQSVLSSA